MRCRRRVANLEGGAAGVRLRLRDGGDRDAARAARLPARTSSPCTTCTAAATGCSRTCASARPGTDVSFVDLTDPAALEAAHPARHAPGVGRDADQSAAEARRSERGGRASRAGAACSRVCDNTFATPYIQRPLEHGFDIVVHSTTKYLNGHSDAIGGAAVVRARRGADRAPRLSAERAGRGARAVRLLPHAARHQDPGAAHGAALRQRARDGAVPGERTRRSSGCYYPGLASHPQHALAQRQMHGGYGGIVTAVLRGGLDDARRMLERCQLFALAESLGGVESLIEHPAIMTHASLPAAHARVARHQRRPDPAVGGGGGRRAT